MVEVEVAHRHDVHRSRIEPCRDQGRHDRRSLVAAHLADLVADPLADPRLDEDATRRRLDQEAVECLQQAVVMIDLLGHERVPEDPRHWPEQRARVGPERSRLDQRDPDRTAELEAPVDRVVQGHR